MIDKGKKEKNLSLLIGDVIDPVELSVDSTLFRTKMYTARLTRWLLRQRGEGRSAPDVISVT